MAEQTWVSCHTSLGTTVLHVNPHCHWCLICITETGGDAIVDTNELVVVDENKDLLTTNKKGAKT